MILDSGTPLLSSRDIAFTAEFPEKVRMQVVKDDILYINLTTIIEIFFLKPEARTGSSNKTWRLEMSAGSFL